MPVTVALFAFSSSLIRSRALWRSFQTLRCSTAPNAGSDACRSSGGNYASGSADPVQC